MLKSIAAASAILSVFAPLTASVAAVPLLSGTYTYTNNKFCQMKVTVTYGTSPSISGPFVQNLISGGGSNVVKLGAGTLKFVQTTAGSGTATLNGFEGSGSAVLLTQTGSGVSGGTDGSPLQTQTKSGSASFSQTATTVTLKSGSTETYHAYYGKTAGGIVQNMVLIGLDSDGCVQQFALSHN